MFGALLSYKEKSPLEAENETSRTSHAGPCGLQPLLPSVGELQNQLVNAEHGNSCDVISIKSCREDLNFAVPTSSYVHTLTLGAVALFSTRRLTRRHRKKDIRHLLMKSAWTVLSQGSWRRGYIGSLAQGTRSSAVRRVQRGSKAVAGPCH